MDSQPKSAENPQLDHNRFIATGKCSSVSVPLFLLPRNHRNAVTMQPSPGFTSQVNHDT